MRPFARRGAAAGLLVVAWSFTVAAGAAPPAPAAPPVRAIPIVPAELLDRPYLYEIARHLYRWYLDEHEVAPAIHRNEFLFEVRMLDPVLDPEDHSRYAEITLPRLGVQVRVKKADYAIPELDLEVRADGYRIVSVTRIPSRADDVEPPAGSVVIPVDYAVMREHLFRTRNDVRPPDGELLEHLASAARGEIADDLEERRERADGAQIVHLAPLSPVANETWIFWETGRLLIHFNADVDLENPALWSHQELAVDLYDIDEQVVVSLDEVPGSNAYLTRDQVGRVLFNCVVLGRRLAVEPGDAVDAPPAPEAPDPD